MRLIGAASIVFAHPVDLVLSGPRHTAPFLHDLFALNLSDAQKADLVEFLKSLSRPPEETATEQTR